MSNYVDTFNKCSNKSKLSTPHKMHKLRNLPLRFVSRNQSKISALFRFGYETVWSISWVLDRFRIEHIDKKCSPDSKLQTSYIRSIRTPSRKWDIFEKPSNSSMRPVRVLISLRKFWKRKTQYYKRQKTSVMKLTFKMKKEQLRLRRRTWIFWLRNHFY